MLRGRRQVGGAFQHLEGVVAHVVQGHLLSNEILADNSLIDAFLEQAEEEVLLVAVRVLLVLAEEGVFGNDGAGDLLVVSLDEDGVVFNVIAA